MLEQDGVALVRRWFDELWQEQRYETLDELLTDPFTRHTSMGTTTMTVAEYRARLNEFQRAHHKPVTTVDDIAVVDDKVWVRATSRGINRETGERSLLTWMLELRVAAGRIAEMWIIAANGVDWTVPT